VMKMNQTMSQNDITYSSAAGWVITGSVSPGGRLRLTLPG
jgi:hypothetical protein